MKQAASAADRNDPDAAITLLKRVIRIDPTASNAYMDLALIYARDKKQPKVAEPYIVKAISLAPKDYVFHWQYAMILHAQDRNREAKEVLLKAKQLSHSDNDEKQRVKTVADLEKHLRQTNR